MPTNSNFNKPQAGQPQKGQHPNQKPGNKKPGMDPDRDKKKLADKPTEEPETKRAPANDGDDDAPGRHSKEDRTDVNDRSERRDAPGNR